MYFGFTNRCIFVVEWVDKFIVGVLKFILGLAVSNTGLLYFKPTNSWVFRFLNTGL